MSLYSAYYVAEYYKVLEYCASVLATLILFSSIDDAFIDAWFWIRELYRSLTIKRTYRPLTVAQLRGRDEQLIAIMVPAWHEHDVIGAMIEDAVRVLEYRNYVIFVGTYRNDPRTIAEVERMRRRYKQLRHVEVPHDGPTCKADCLNWVVQAVVRYEQHHGTQFAGMVMHDSEDVLHPLELKFFNYLLPRKDMIQLPVVSLERNWYELVAGTYMDEFAEWHGKDLVVRESITGTVPSAGTGTCFSRRAMQALIDATDRQPFNPDSLTEDYDVGTRLGRMGMSAIFVRFPVQFRTMRTRLFGLLPSKEITLTMPLCVREFFPDNLRAAYRQKARWVMGIGLQNWQQTGWTGSFTQRYLLFRDRKSIVTAFIGILAYVVALQYLVLIILAGIGFDWLPIPSPVIEAAWLRVVLVINAVMVILRVTQRAYFVSRLYGWEQALIAIPRSVVSNFVNFLAVTRAWRLFGYHLLTGKRLVWDKTMHDFPSTDGLAAGRHLRLGELLVSWQAIAPAQLEEALKDDFARQVPLGRVLMTRGWLDEETLAEAIAFQGDLERVHFDLAKVEASKDRLPLDVATLHSVLIHGEDALGHTIILSASVLPDDVMLELATAMGYEDTRHVVQHVASESEINTGVRMLRGADRDEVVKQTRVPLLGDLMIEFGYVTRERFFEVLSRYQPERHGRIGDFMVAQGVITQEGLQAAIAAQARAREVTASQPAPVWAVPHSPSDMSEPLPGASSGAV
ncbi:glycosyl transferase family protein [Robbsia andropogonis]|uniref:glycosyl transferase family protein n=1 Tax=Robbsia andropogonis TaxID=28092 RepID=UPI002A6A7641|nr:glycosyl transferase family protein [Robbsia andropogonis]